MSSFFSRLVVLSIWFFKHENIFLIWAITWYIYIAIVKKMLIVFFQPYSKQNFCITGNVLYITRVIIQWFFSYQNSLLAFLRNYKVMRKRTGGGYKNTSLYLHIVYFLKKLHKFLFWIIPLKNPGSSSNQC